MQMEALTGSYSPPLISLLLLRFVVSYSLTVFSPSGKLVQIEHALAAVSQGTTSLGIKGTLSTFVPYHRLIPPHSIQRNRHCH
jgi:hypothetical protein